MGDKTKALENQLTTRYEIMPYEKFRGIEKSMSSTSENVSSPLHHYYGKFEWKCWTQYREILLGWNWNLVRGNIGPQIIDFPRWSPGRPIVCFSDPRSIGWWSSLTFAMRSSTRRWWTRSLRPRPRCLAARPAEIRGFHKQRSGFSGL